jgi:hypothetical protein
MVRIIMCLILIGVGGFAIYTVWAKPDHPYSSEPIDQAIGIPKIVNRVIRGAVGLLFIAFGIIGILRTFNVLSQ